MKIINGSRQLAVTSLAVLVVLLISLSWALADISPSLEEWNRTLGGSQADGGFSVQETSDGGYIIAGYTMSFGSGQRDVYLVKTDSQGRETWNRTFGGSQDDWGYSIQETSDGGYIITGSTMSSGAGEGDVYLVKTDSQGRETWSTTFGGSQADGGFSVQETSDGGYIIAGSTMSFGLGSSDVYLVKTDSQGMETWSTTFGGSQADGGYSVQETSDGGYIISGVTASSGAGGTDVYLVKTDSQGMEAWSTTFGGSQDDLGYSIQETSDGGYIISGYTMSVGAGGHDVYLVKVDSQGRETWSTAFGGSGHDFGWSVREISDGGYIIAGHTMSFGAGEGDVFLVKADSQGMETWSTTFGGAQDDCGYSVQAASDGGYIIVGYTMSLGAGGSDVYLLKVDQGGVEERYSASLVDLEAPSEVYAGASFTVELTVSYEFTFPTEMNAGINDVETETWITGEPEVFEGEGTKIYSFELTAPEVETTWVFEARVGYILEGEWSRNEVGSSDVFEISVVDQGGVEETYTASIVDLEAPSEVYTGESFTVEVTVSYEFTFSTEMSPGIVDVEAEKWIAEEYETLVGEGTKTYTFELMAPDEETMWAIEAGVGYMLEGEWARNEVGSSDVFEVSVVEEEGGGGSGIPGFPYLSIAFGLIFVFLLRDKFQI